jgi:hypothetical protein
MFANTVNNVDTILGVEEPVSAPGAHSGIVERVLEKLRARECGLDWNDSGLLPGVTFSEDGYAPSGFIKAAKSLTRRVGCQHLVK